MKINNSIDIFKFIAACLVMSIHICPLASGNMMLNSMFNDTVARIAVPFFFTIAGYFLYSKMENSRGIKSYIIKLIKLYIIWSLIYFPIIFYTWIGNGTHILLDVIFYIRNVILIGAYIQLWYLPALIFSVAILFLLLKKFSLRICLLISSCLYLIGLLGDGYYGISVTLGFSKYIDKFTSFFGSTRNGLFFGMFFVCLGMYIKAHPPKNHLKTYKYLGILASLLLMIIEVYILKKSKFAHDYNMYISLIPAIYFLVLILVNANLKFKLKICLRSLSLTMYLTHMWIFLIYKKIIDIIELDVLKNSFIRYIIVLALSIVIHCLIVQFKNIYQLKNAKVTSLKLNS
ncbi:acyltransferase family protein [Clostridium tarantellae]|uniref:acyltransferase family protein n=1 Tax=Clostridium tarantellae TaxID=39493 RepID=UPI0014788203|nr:acyltransferase [Clostridium tarantellae]